MEHMLKSMSLSDYHFPYVVLISKFLQYFEVFLDRELSEVVKPIDQESSSALKNPRCLMKDWCCCCVWVGSG